MLKFLPEILKINRILYRNTRISVQKTAFFLTLFFISFYGFSQHSASATYTSGHIDTDRDFMSTGKSSCPGEITVTIPIGVQITSVDVQYTMTALGGSNMNQQRSQLRCVSEGGTNEATIAQGVGATGGTYVYSRTGLTIANDVECGGDILFELHAGRTANSNSCNANFNRVDNNSWTVTVHYKYMDEDTELSNGGLLDDDSISATFIGYGDRQMVFDFTISDIGTSDGNPTTIDKIVFTQGAYNQFAEWNNFIAGASLYGPDLGEVTGSELLGQVIADSIIFTGTEIISVANFESETYQLRIWIIPGISSSYDNQLFHFQLNSSNVEIPLCYKSSRMGDFDIESTPVALYFARDENSSVTEGDAAEPSSLWVTHAAFGSRIDVLDFKLIDMGTGDEAATIVDKISIKHGPTNEILDWREVVDGATLYGPDLGEYIEFEAFGVVDSAEIRFNLPDMISVADGSDETYVLRVWLNPSILTIYDNKIIDFQLDYTDIETSTKFSSVFGFGNISSGGILLFPKDTLSQIAFADSITPPTISSLNNSEPERLTVFNFSINDDGFDGFETIVEEIIFTQSPENQIDDWTTVIAGATLYGPDLGEDSGAELTGVITENAIVFSNPQMLIVADSSNETYQLRIWITDSLNDCKVISFLLLSDSISVDTLGSRFGTSSAQSQDITIVFEKEDETKIEAGEMAIPTKIASTTDSFEDRLSILDFKLTDLGTDRFNTSLDKMVFTKGASNTIIDWTHAIAGASLYGPDLGEISGDEILADIYPDSIVFDDDIMIYILENDTETYVLNIWLRTDLQINDNDTLDIKLQYQNVTTSDCNSSWMLNGSIETGPIKIDIEATQLAFFTNQPPLYVEAGVEFTVTVRAVDDNFNFDSDVNIPFEIELHTGTGILSSVSGLSQTLVDGLYTWNDVIYNTAEKLLIRAFSDYLNEGISDTVICVLEFADVSEGANAEPVLISSTIFEEADRIMVFDFVFNDHGIADGYPTIIDGLTIKQGILNEIEDWTDAIDGATLYGPDLGELSGTELTGTVNSDNISFSEESMITIEDGDNETYQLKIWLKADLSEINHNDKLEFSLDYSDIIVQSSESTIFGSGTVVSDSISVYIEPINLVFDVGTPPSVVGYSNDFTVTVRVTDDNGNYNTTATDTILISKYMGAGSLQSDTGLTKALIDGTYTWTEISYNNLGFFRIQATAPGLNTVISDSIESIIDEDSEISCGPTTEQIKFSSTRNTQAKRLAFMDFTIIDKGTADGLPTYVSTMVFTQGLANEIPDWTAAIEGASIYGPGLGQGSGSELYGTVTTTEIIFDSYKFIEVPDGTSRTYTLKIWLYADLSGINDNDSIDISIDYSNITPPVLGSSYFNAGSCTSGGVAVDITATQLVFAKNQPPTIVGFSYNFVSCIRAVDDNANLDTDASDIITLALYQGTGLLTSPVNFTQALVGGLYYWYETKYNKDEVFRLRVVSNTLTQGLSDVIMCKKCVRGALYTLEDIPTDREFTSLPGSSSCPGTLSIFVPSFAIITSCDVFYTINTHATPGKKSDQRSQLRCVSPGGLSEPVLYEGSGAQGAQEYRRLNLDIANDVEIGADVVFELHAGRTDKGNNCGTSFNQVDNYTWTVLINYIILGVHWTGEIDSDWNNPYNWACEIVPTRYLDVYILADAVNPPVINTDAEVRTLNIESGATLTITDGKTLSVYGDLTVNGTLNTIDNDAILSFNGNGSTPTGKQSVYGLEEIQFNDVVVETQAYVKLFQDINIVGDLSIKGTLEATQNKPIYINGESNSFTVETGGKFIPKLSTVHFIGKERQKIKSGTASFYNLNVNTAEKDHQLILLDNLTVNNKLSLTKGVLNLNTKQLIINTNSTSGINNDVNDVGYIYAETEPLENFDNRVVWKMGSNIGTFTIPFGVDTNKILPVAVELFYNNMGNEGYLSFSTYRTNNLSQPLPYNVPHMGGVLEGEDEEAYANRLGFVVDRFWYFDYPMVGKEDARSRIEGFISMSYEVSELDNVIESEMIAQRFNDVKSTWADLIYTQKDYSSYSEHGFSINTPVEPEEVIGRFQTSYVDTAQFFNVWALGSSDLFLPIKLLKFEANCIAVDNIELKWTTATETNNHFFTIERSYDATNWNPVATVEGAYNSSTQKNYSFIDNNTYGIISYYRLKQTDFDGNTEILKSIAVNCNIDNDNQNIVFYPNPVSDFVNVYFYNIEDENTLIELYDGLGKLILSRNLRQEELNSGMLNLNMSKYADGVYVLCFKSDDYTYTEKIIKQKK